MSRTLSKCCISRQVLHTLREDQLRWSISSFPAQIGITEVQFLKENILQKPLIHCFLLFAFFKHLSWRMQKSLYHSFQKSLYLACNPWSTNLKLNDNKHSKIMLIKMSFLKFLSKSQPSQPCFQEIIFQLSIQHSLFLTQYVDNKIQYMVSEVLGCSFEHIYKYITGKF